jgi:hypothetical protein
MTMGEQAPRKPYAVGPKQQFVKLTARSAAYTEGYAVIRRETPEGNRQMIAKYKTIEAARELCDLLNKLHSEQA